MSSAVNLIVCSYRAGLGIRSGGRGRQGGQGRSEVLAAELISLTQSCSFE